jgi:uncharacterized protein (DUF1778 family)
VERTIERTQLILVSMADQERIMKVLSKPPKVTPALKRAFAVHRKLIRPSE